MHLFRWMKLHIMACTLNGCDNSWPLQKWALFFFVWAIRGISGSIEYWVVEMTWVLKVFLTSLDTNHCSSTNIGIKDSNCVHIYFLWVKVGENTCISNFVSSMFWDLIAFLMLWLRWIRIYKHSVSTKSTTDRVSNIVKEVSVLLTAVMCWTSESLLDSSCTNVVWDSQTWAWGWESQWAEQGTSHDIKCSHTNSFKIISWCNPSNKVVVELRGHDHIPSNTDLISSPENVVVKVQVLR